MVDTIGIGVIGTGIMGASHAMAFQSAPTIFETAIGARLEVIGDVNQAAAQKAAQRFGFKRAVGGLAHFAVHFSLERFEFLLVQDALAHQEQPELRDRVAPAFGVAHLLRLVELFVV